MTEETVADCVSTTARMCQTPVDRGRLRTTVEEHFENVWRFLRRLGLSSVDADDAAQDVMMVLAQKLDVVKPGSERSFLFSTAFRVAMRFRRARARSVEDDEFLEAQQDPHPGPEALSDEVVARFVLDKLLNGLPLDLRAVFILTEIDEMTAAQVALLLDLPPGTVASRLRRAREIFDERLARFHARQRIGGET